MEVTGEPLSGQSTQSLMIMEHEVMQAYTSAGL